MHDFDKVADEEMLKFINDHDFENVKKFWKDEEVWHDTYTDENVSYDELEWYADTVEYNIVSQLALYGDIEEIDYYLQRGAKIGPCAIPFAAFNGHLETIKYLVQKLKQGYGRLNARTVIDLMKNKKNVNVSGSLNKKDRNGDAFFEIHCAAVPYAAYNGHLDVIKYLMDNGYVLHTIYEINDGLDGWSGYLNTEEIKKMTIGDTIDTEDIAKKRDFPEIVEYLEYIKRHPYIKIDTVEEDCDEIVRISEWIKNGDFENVKKHWQSRLELHVDDYTRKNPGDYYFNEDGFIYAEVVSALALLGKTDEIDYYIQRGAYIGIKAIPFAAFNGHLDTVKYLVEQLKLGRGSLDYKDLRYFEEKLANEYSPKMQTTYGSYPKLPKTDKNGHAFFSIYPGAIGYAAYNGHLDVIKFLIENGYVHKHPHRDRGWKCSSVYSVYFRNCKLTCRTDRNLPEINSMEMYCCQDTNGIKYVEATTIAEKRGFDDIVEYLQGAVL